MISEYIRQINRPQWEMDKEPYHFNLSKMPSSAVKRQRWNKKEMKKKYTNQPADVKCVSSVLQGAPPGV